MKPKLITVTEMQTLLGIKKTKAWALLKSGEVESGKIGGRRLVRRSSVLKLIERSIVSEDE